MIKLLNNVILWIMLKEVNQMKKATTILKFIFLCGLAFLMTACQNQANRSNQDQENSQASEIVQESTTEAVPDRYVTVRSIGDILLHDYVYWDGATPDGSYNFDKMFTQVKPYLENADITTANMETIVAGSKLGVSSYPVFNAPEQIIDTLKNVGVDIVNNATNHTMDWGPEGALASIATLKEKGMPYVGSYESWDDYNTPRVLDVNGVKVGFLAYTYGLNGNYLPEDQTYLATLIDNELIRLEIERLKKFCDVSIVIFHIGEENDFYPSAWQEEVFNVAKEAGANFVIGGHPHVLQPGIIWNESQAGFYSHGNFLSGQVQLDQKVGSIWEYRFKIDSNNKVTIDQMRMMPTYNPGYPEFANYSVLPLADAADLGVVDVPAKFAELKDRIQTYNPEIEVVEYLD